MVHPAIRDLRPLRWIAGKQISGPLAGEANIVAPSLDGKLTKEQDLSFRDPRPEHVGDASLPVGLRRLNAISPDSNRQTAVRSPAGSSSRSPGGSARAGKTDRMRRYGPDGR
jgi:hypothetical protein